MKPWLIWTALAAVIAVSIIAAAFSPFLAYRSAIYIAAGFAGVIGLAVLLIQPLLAGGYLPGVGRRAARRLHRLLGMVLLVMVIAHVAGLWITSPPDVIDALLFTSPTPFSAWGVVAMWAIFVSALMVSLRHLFRGHQVAWRLLHRILAAVIVLGTVIHALLIEGTMEPISKAVLCGVVLLAVALVLLRFRAFGT